MKFSTPLVTVGALLATTAQGFAPAATSTTTTVTRITRASTLSSSQSSALRASSVHLGDSSDKRVDQAIVDQLNAQRKASGQREPPIDTILEADFFVAVTMLIVGPMVALLYPAAGEGALSVIGSAGMCLHILLAGLIGIQTRRVRCVFEDDGFEFYNLKGPGLDLANGGRLEKKPGNFVVDGENRWKYDKITGYTFFPSKAVPLLVIMTECQTGANNAYYGSDQPHFYPVLFDAKAFEEEMKLRGVPRRGF